MKVSNVSMFQFKSVEEAIHETIKEHFNKVHSEKLINALQINGYIGKCSYIEDNKITVAYLATTYFIVTDIWQGFQRVEVCKEISKLELE